MMTISLCWIIEVYFLTIDVYLIQRKYKGQLQSAQFDIKYFVSEKTQFIKCVDGFLGSLSRLSSMSLTVGSFEAVLNIVGMISTSYFSRTWLYVFSSSLVRLLDFEQYFGPFVLFRDIGNKSNAVMFTKFYIQELTSYRWRSSNHYTTLINSPYKHMTFMSGDMSFGRSLTALHMCSIMEVG